ncbi:hypothetical protein [Bradyrhizobium elkanii]|uniref:hypothetical protein n=1 Tax=Bradyrhizobium elkanii TaxID=29448 RepID=UPI000841F67B|nr:hypothetical protein [Bradyrhizobium elkanii]ODM71792.1 hypothetical protein A6X20_07040 [Bradyrhizobium elkanii]ODM79062.1 hypothetical protein A6452_28625 [Bradyrhizobium elkanii]
MSEIFDLFGDPVPANWGQRGRPEHIPTQQNRNRVSMLVALGWSNPRIAAAMLVTLPTLRKHYFSELKYRDVARDRLNANLATKLWSLFMDGNVAAGKEFRKFMDVNDRMELERSMATAPGDKPSASERVGKKQLDARRAADADADLMAELEQEATAQNAVH